MLSLRQEGRRYPILPLYVAPDSSASRQGDNHDEERRAPSDRGIAGTTIGKILTLVAPDTFQSSHCFSVNPVQPAQRPRDFGTEQSSQSLSRIHVIQITPARSGSPSSGCRKIRVRFLIVVGDN